MGEARWDEMEWDRVGQTGLENGEQLINRIGPRKGCIHTMLAEKIKRY